MGIWNRIFVCESIDQQILKSDIYQITWLKCSVSGGILIYRMFRKRTKMWQNPTFPKPLFSKILLTLNSIFPKCHFCKSHCPQIPFSWRGGDIHMKLRTNLEGWGHTYERTNELGGGHVNMNEYTCWGGRTYERTN